eukprot:2566914-Prymnesium_polylepis.1
MSTLSAGASLKEATAPPTVSSPSPSSSAAASPHAHSSSSVTSYGLPPLSSCSKTTCSAVRTHLGKVRDARVVGCGGCGNPRSCEGRQGDLQRLAPVADDAPRVADARLALE